MKLELIKYFEKKGWKVSGSDKIRGRRPDLVFRKDDELAVVKVKGAKANTDTAIKQTLHYKNAVNYAYLSMPHEAISKSILNSCDSLGIGLITKDGKIKEMIRPIRSKALQSVKEKFFVPIPKKEPEIKKRSSLEKLFRSKSLILILKLLLLNSTQEFHLNEIARRVGISASTAHKELSTIKTLGLVRGSKKGNLVLYKINKESIIYEEVKRIFLKYELADEIIAKELQKQDIKFALIFGSFAKGVETQVSDIDLLLIGDVKRDNLLNSVTKLQSSIGRSINFILWTEDEFIEKIRQNNPLLQDIVKNPKIMIIGDESEFTRIIK